MVSSGIAAYQEAQAQELDQAKLILMMYAGAVRFLDKAMALSNTDRRESGAYISRTKDIILELIASLNLDEGGEIGEILLHTYRGLFTKLNIAYIDEDYGKVDEVRQSLADLEDAWKQVFNSPEYQEFKRSRGTQAQVSMR